MNRILLTCTIAVALVGLLFGYDTVIINGAMLDLVKHFQLAPAAQGWTVSSALVGCLLSAILVGKPGDYFGSHRLLQIPDNLSSEMVGPELFEIYMADYKREWTTKIREAVKYSFIHIDGTLAGLLKQEASMGFTVLEALTPYPVGDLKFGELEQFCDDSKSILWGGIPGSYFTAYVDDNERTSKNNSIA